MSGSVRVRLRESRRPVGKRRGREPELARPDGGLSRVIYDWYMQCRGRGWRQSDCAKRMGVGLRTFQRWIGGEEPSRLGRKWVLRAMADEGVRVPKRLYDDE